MNRAAGYEVLRLSKSLIGQRTRSRGGPRLAQGPQRRSVCAPGTSPSPHLIADWLAQGSLSSCGLTSMGRFVCVRSPLAPGLRRLHTTSRSGSKSERGRYCPSFLAPIAASRPDRSTPQAVPRRRTLSINDVSVQEGGRGTRKVMVFTRDAAVRRRARNGSTSNFATANGTATTAQRTTGRPPGRCLRPRPDDGDHPVVVGPETRHRSRTRDVLRQPQARWDAGDGKRTATGNSTHS